MQLHENPSSLRDLERGQAVRQIDKANTQAFFNCWKVLKMIQLNLTVIKEYESLRRLRL